MLQSLDEQVALAPRWPASPFPGLRPFRVTAKLRNADTNYPFESSRGFPGSEPNCGHGDQSRLSCSAGDKQLGAGFCRDLQCVLHRRWPSCGVAEKARIGRDLFRSEDDPPAAKANNTIAQF